MYLAELNFSDNTKEILEFETDNYDDFIKSLKNSIKDDLVLIESVEWKKVTEMGFLNKSDLTGKIGYSHNDKYFRGVTDNGICFKSYSAFENKEGVCYIAENSDLRYTYNDFLELACGNEKLAKNIFDIVDWQHPETVLDEMNLNE
jgi:hypothetical protein